MSFRDTYCIIVILIPKSQYVIFVYIYGSLFRMNQVAIFGGLTTCILPLPFEEHTLLVSQASSFVPHALPMLQQHIRFVHEPSTFSRLPRVS